MKPKGLTEFSLSNQAVVDLCTFDLAGLIEGSAAQVEAEGGTVFQAESGLIVTGRPAG